MFSVKGLFKNIACPNLEQCNLPSCIFSHDIKVVQHSETTAPEYDPLSAGNVSPPPLKRRRLDNKHDGLVEGTTSQGNKAINTDVVKSGLLSTSKSTTRAQNTAVPVRDISTTKSDALRSVIGNKASTKNVVPTGQAPKTATRPSAQEEAKPSPTKESEDGKVEPLMPRNISKPPLPFKIRLTIVQKLHEQMVAQNETLKKSQLADVKQYVLANQKIVTLVLDEEQKAAVTFKSDIYRNQITQRITTIKRMKADDWLAYVKDRTQSKQDAKASSQKKTVRSELDLDPANSVRKLHEMLSRQSKISDIVWSPPSEVDITSVRLDLKTAANWETCDRCSTRFQVYPGRDEEGQLTSKGACSYHWGRTNRGPSSKTQRITGAADMTYTCCQQPLGTPGCDTAQTHVFKVTDPKRLASLWQWQEIPEESSSATAEKAITFDCEMAYTTFGMEVVRVTALSWPSDRIRLDVLVRPYGEILDFNTRFSGITKQMFAGAIEYRTQDATSSDGKIAKVASPVDARSLLFGLIDRETILIGHGIENDLNVLRIIPTKVADTIQLFPHPRGPPYRPSLKHLATEHLGRGIQMEGDLGHDSKEDALATSDLVKVAVAAERKKTAHLA